MLNNIIPINDKKDIYWIGVNDFETHLFEATWPLPDGVTYNSYLIKDEKVAIIETVKSTTEDLYLDKIQELTEDGNLKIDYLVIDHMEPDHCGGITTLVKRFPEMKVVGNKKTLEFIRDFYRISDEHLMEIKEGDILDLGKHKLKFFLIPMVHWPETMVTYDMTDKIAFTCDAFGSFGTLNGGIFDDEVNLESYKDETIRYYSNIVGRYSKMVQKAIKKLSGLEINTIAPGHGVIFRKNPGYIIDFYDKLSKQETEKGAVVVYASMYGNTMEMAVAVARGLSENGIKDVKLHNVSKTDASYLIRDIWKYKGFILGSVTYNTHMFPAMQELVHHLDHMNLENRFLGLFGSYSWSKGGLKELQEFAGKTKLEIVEPDIESKCHPTPEDLEKCYELGKNMAQKILNS